MSDKTSKYNINIDIKEIENIAYHIETKTLSNTAYKFNISKASKLILEFSGKDLNFRIINTLRRVAHDDIPTYAFPTSLINVSANNTIYNNDQIKLRLSQIPIINTDLDLYYLDSIYWKDVNYADPKRIKHKLEKSIEISINEYNDTNKVKHITTNNIKYYENGNIIENKYNKECPLLITQLRPAETFTCSLRAALGLGDFDDIWSAVSNIYYDDIGTEENPKILFYIESQGQFDEYTILIKSCKFIKQKLQELKKEVEKKFNTKEINEQKEIILVFDGEDHTMGEIINYAFQNHPDIIYSGVAKIDHLLKSIRITVVSADTIKSPLIPMMEQFKYLDLLFSYLEDKITNLSKKK